ncbi:MAG: hypothetical protein JNG84_15535 [Archangium sp.]|nr:hypothetical protein [Archangium sp.]
MTLTLRALVVLAASATAFAQEPPPEPSSPPLPPVEEPAPPQEILQPPYVANPPLPPDAPMPPRQEPGYMQRCFGVPAVVWFPGGVVVVRGSGTSSSSSSGPGPSGQTHRAGPVGTSSPASGSLDGRALVILGVVLAAVLPVAVYVFDSEAPQVVQQRFRCPTFAFDGVGGALGSTTLGLVGASFGGRFTAAFGYLGLDAEFDVSGLFSQFATHLLLRPVPKKHIEGGLALGYRRLVTSSGVRDGFDLGLPHTYVFWRDGLRQVGLELRPSLLVGGAGVDGGVEASVVVPIVQLLHLRLGGRVFTAGADVLWGGHAGLRLTL